MNEHPGDVPSNRCPGISVTLINDYEIVVRGLASMLAPYQDRVRVVELGTSDTPAEGADIALFDTFAGRRHTLTRAADMLRSGQVEHVVLYTWDAGPELVKAAKEMGVAGVVLKTRSADALVESLERIARGEMVGLDGEGDDAAQGRSAQLSERESEVLALIAKGFTNAEIADELYLSIETVKTYVKRLYSKLSVHNRVQAAVAAASHHFTPREDVSGRLGS